MTVWGDALRRSTAQNKVPCPWDLGIQLRRGNLAVVMGSPGIGKSLFALNWLLGVQEHSVLVSLDTDLTTQSLRACSILSNAPLRSVTLRPAAWAQYLDKKNFRCRIYDLSLDTETINELVLAEEEYWGSAPALVVVDNVSNVVRDISYEAYRATFIGLQKVARLRDTAVVALHHVKRDSASGRPSLHSGQYSGEQEAEVVIGLSRDGLNGSASTLVLSILKNRNGPADPSGNYFKTLNLDHETLRLTQ